MGINAKSEVIEWKFNKSCEKKKKPDYSYLFNQPSYHFYKMKFSKILINSSVCMALESKNKKN